MSVKSKSHMYYSALPYLNDNASVLLRLKCSRNSGAVFLTIRPTVQQIIIIIRPICGFKFHTSVHICGLLDFCMYLVHSPHRTSDTDTTFTFSYGGK